MLTVYSFRNSPTFEGYVCSQSILSQTRGYRHSVLEHFLAYDLNAMRWVKLCFGTKSSKAIAMRAAQGGNFMRIMQSGDKLAPKYDVSALNNAALAKGAGEALQQLFGEYRIQPLFEVAAKTSNNGAAVRAMKDLGDLLPEQFAHRVGEEMPAPARTGPADAARRPAMPIMWERSDSSSQTSEVLGNIQCKDIAEGRLQLRVEGDDGVRLYQTAARVELIGLFDGLAPGQPWRLKRRVRYGANGEILAVLEHSIVPA